MSSINFKTENNILRKLLGNGLSYTIPRFQRDYSWNEEQWEDLWLDILSVLDKKDSFHYMGYLVLQSSDDKEYYVIDGQQRLTTVTIIILAVLSNITKLISQGIDPNQNNQQRLELIRQSYIGYIDPVSLISKSKLTLNRNNNAYFQNYLIPLQKLPSRGLKASEHLLKKSFEYFDKKVESLIKDKPQVNRGEYLAKFVDCISDKLFFTVITVDDELNAYTVFETLNARGVRLSSTDLLKNYLFSVIDSNDNLEQASQEIENIEKRWEKLVCNLESEKFPDFLRIYWNSRNKHTRQTELFKTIKNKIQNRAGVFNLIREMDEDLENYLSLIYPDTSKWSKKDTDNTKILKMLKVKQPYSLLLSAKRCFNDNDFSDLLNAIKIISFRYSTIGSYNPTDLERIYNEIACMISNNEIMNMQSVWPLLKEAYIDDKRFVSDFSEKIMKTTDTRIKKIVKYILCEIEKYVSGTAVDSVSDNQNIEHIIPQNADDGWGDLSSSEIESLLYRLGNMTLMNSVRNNDVADAPYETKRIEYQISDFCITKKIASEYANWDGDSISSWQNYLATIAKTIWRISQLS